MRERHVSTAGCEDKTGFCKVTKADNVFFRYRPTPLGRKAKLDFMPLQTHTIRIQTIGLFTVSKAK